MTPEEKRKQSFLLRLPASIREQAISMAHEEETSLNHFISLAVAEKLSRRGKQPTAQEQKAGLGFSLVGCVDKVKKTG